MNSEEERKIAKRVKGLTIQDQSRRNKPPKIPPGLTLKEIGKLTVDEFVVNVLFAEKDPDDMTFDEIREALAYYLPESRFARKRKRTDTDAHALTLVVDEPEFNGVENVDAVGPSGGGEAPKEADGNEGPEEKEEVKELEME